jgi:hypothetical protein
MTLGFLLELGLFDENADLAGDGRQELHAFGCEVIFLPRDDTHDANRPAADREGKCG